MVTEITEITKFIEMKQKDLKILRDKLLKDQNGICPICKKEIQRAVLDHFHRRKIKGTGLCRGVLCNSCNFFLGRIENSCARAGIKIDDLDEILLNLVNYRQNFKTNYVHPTEFKKITKKQVENIQKYFREVYPRKILPEFPESMNMNSQFKKIIKDIKEYMENNSVTKDKLKKKPIRRISSTNPS